MTPQEFETAVADAFALVPEKFSSKVKNVAFLIEEEPDETVRQENKLQAGETLFGLYRGIPHTERGDGYGVGATLPDSITIYRKPILEAAAHEAGVEVDWGLPTEPMKKRIKAIIRDTIWHEIAHYFGMDELEIGAREEAGTNQ